MIPAKLATFIPMIPPYVTEESIHAFLHQAFQEDVGDGDHSTLASIPEDATDSASLLMKRMSSSRKAG